MSITVINLCNIAHCFTVTPKWVDSSVYVRDFDSCLVGNTSELCTNGVCGDSLFTVAVA